MTGAAMPLRKVRDMHARLSAYLTEAQAIEELNRGVINWDHEDVTIEILRNGWTTVALLEMEIGSRARPTPPRSHQSSGKRRIV